VGVMGCLLEVPVSAVAPEEPGRESPVIVSIPVQIVRLVPVSILPRFSTKWVLRCEVSRNYVLANQPVQPGSSRDGGTEEAAERVVLSMYG
jgi:hypothetical protein